MVFPFTALRGTGSVVVDRLAAGAQRGLPMSLPPRSDHDERGGNLSAPLTLSGAPRRLLHARTRQLQLPSRQSWLWRG